MAAMLRSSVFMSAYAAETTREASMGYTATSDTW